MNSNEYKLKEHKLTESNNPRKRKAKANPNNAAKRQKLAQKNFASLPSDMIIPIILMLDPIDMVNFGLTHRRFLLCLTVELPEIIKLGNSREKELSLTVEEHVYLKALRPEIRDVVCQKRRGRWSRYYSPSLLFRGGPVNLRSDLRRFPCPEDEEGYFNYLNEQEKKLLMGDLDKIGPELASNSHNLLCWACEYNHPAVVNRLLQLPAYGDDFELLREGLATSDHEPLRRACGNECVAVLSELLSTIPYQDQAFLTGGLAQNRHNALFSACQSVEVVRLLLSTVPYQNPDFLAKGLVAHDHQLLRDACESGYLELVKLLLLTVPYQDQAFLAEGLAAHDHQPLRDAGRSGCLELVKLLLLTVPYQDQAFLAEGLAAHDHQPLRNAGRSGCVELVRLLLSLPAYAYNINFQDIRRTAWSEFFGSEGITSQEEQKGPSLR